MFNKTLFDMLVEFLPITCHYMGVLAL